MFGCAPRKSRDIHGDVGPIPKQDKEQNSNARQISNGGDDLRQLREENAPGTPNHVRLSKRNLTPHLSKEDSIRSSSSNDDHHHQYVVEPKTFQEFGDILNGNDVNDLIVIDFYAPWCGPCKKIAPAFLTLSKEYQERILFVKVNVDKIEDALAAMSVEAMPTFVAMKGKREVDRIVGGDQMALEGLVAKLAGY